MRRLFQIALVLLIAWTISAQPSSAHGRHRGHGFGHRDRIFFHERFEPRRVVIIRDRAPRRFFFFRAPEPRRVIFVDDDEFFERDGVIVRRGFVVRDGFVVREHPRSVILVRVR